MPTTPTEYQTARQIALSYFEHKYKSGEEFEAAMRGALDVAHNTFPSVNVAVLRNDLETSVNIQIGPTQTLVSDEDHVPWLRQKQHEIDWKFWQRYRTFLLHRRKLPLQVVDRIDEVADEILALLEDPTAKGRAFDRRGLVVGYVQSGKTTNYSALINKAMDAGYKLIIVLAGTYNNLRSQTQVRLDEDVLGFDTARSLLSEGDQGRFGVGTLGDGRDLLVGSLTNWKENGDFRKAQAEKVLVHVGQTPLLLIVKKNVSVLGNLVRYFRDFGPAVVTDSSGRRLVIDVPLLVIDDEADHASVNTGEIPKDEDGHPVDDYNPTRINQLIRELLHSFSQSVYVGYTATPFANIFIHNDAAHRDYGEDIFPRSFITNLSPPDNYIGPKQLLGIGVGGDEPMPIFRSADDADSMLAEKHRKGTEVGELADSLKQAVQAFLLSASARRARGFVNNHNSMLIHVTQFTDVQEQVAVRVDNYLRDLQRQMKWGGDHEADKLKHVLRELWLTDFLPTSKKMGADAPPWEAVEAELAASANRTLLRVINGTSADVLDYRENADTGINVIAIGGNKLSRGLTLEGLTVSYFRRTSKMYDTLMQMGRWFGYRDDYADLCRVYTTGELREWFTHISDASEELRAEFEYMRSIGGSPKDFGLRVKAHSVLIVTSRVKSRSGTMLDLTYEGDVSETTLFHRTSDVLDRNFARTERFLQQLGAPHGNDRFIWEGVDVGEILQFLSDFETHSEAPRADARRLADYIRAQNGVDPPELTMWTVALISQPWSDDLYPTRLAGLPVNCIRRQKLKDEVSKFSIRRLLSPTDEGLDIPQALREAEYRRLLENLADGEEVPFALDHPPATWLRHIRTKERGLLLIYPLDPSYLQQSFITKLPVLEQVPIGLGFSFPGSRSGIRTKYVVNRVWLDEEA